MFCKFVNRIFILLVESSYTCMVKEFQSKIVWELNADYGGVVTWVVCCLENYYKSAFNFLKLPSLRWLTTPFFLISAENYLMNNKIKSQIGKTNMQFFMKIWFSKILSSKYWQKPQADSNSLSDVHMKPNTLSTELWW